jgi:hypothetical protein
MAQAKLPVPKPFDPINQPIPMGMIPSPRQAPTRKVLVLHMVTWYPRASGRSIMVGKMEERPKPNTTLAPAAVHKVWKAKVRRQMAPRVLRPSWRRRDGTGGRQVARGMARRRPRVMAPQNMETE